MVSTFAGVTPAFAQEFANDWVASWNAHDLDPGTRLERVLAHYTEEFTMSSPYIVRVMGEPSGRLHGKEAVRAYWKVALERFPDLHFTLRTVTVGADSIALLYDSSRSGTVIEWFRFNREGLVTDAAGHYELGIFNQ